MKNKELIDRFLNGAVSGKGSNLYIRGNLLINYNTCICVRMGRSIYLDDYSYSISTRRNQNYIKANWKWVTLFETNSDLRKYVSVNFGQDLLPGGYYGREDLYEKEYTKK